MSFTYLHIFFRQLIITVFLYYLFSIVVQDKFKNKSTRYNWFAAVIFFLYAALQRQQMSQVDQSTVRQMVGIKARYDTLSCTAYYERDLGSGLPRG